jgi:processive 1,2-diacylglycerol beta-glucosyltransferase
VVSGPVVRPAFLRPAEDTARDRVRAELGIPADSRVALVSTGSVGLAGSAQAAAEAIASRTGWVPVVLCGRSEELRAQMQQVPGAVALGWVEDTQRLLAAADVLVDNAGGMSSKEALGFGVPVVTFRPISGHGRDDAAALERLGLTDVVEDPRRLVDLLDGIVQDAPGRRERVARGRALFVADAADLVEQATSRAPARLREMATATVPAGRGRARHSRRPRSAKTTAREGEGRDGRQPGYRVVSDPPGHPASRSPGQPVTGSAGHRVSR